MSRQSQSFSVPEIIDKDRLKDILCRVWMRHDALWFSYCLQEGGIEMTNRLNQAAVRGFAAYEARQLPKLAGLKDGPNNFAELEIFIRHMFGTMAAASFMDVAIEFQEDMRIKISWNKCFAFEGVARLGVIEEYECGVFTRVEAWFDSWHLKWQVAPRVKGCMFHQQGCCFREYEFTFNNLKD